MVRLVGFEYSSRSVTDVRTPSVHNSLVPAGYAPYTVDQSRIDGGSNTNADAKSPGVAWFSVGSGSFGHARYVAYRRRSWVLCRTV